MNELVSNLERIGLSQYLESFVEEGFDTWETILYITESDLDALGVRLGHRRRLQKEIAQARNIGFESLIPQIGPIVTAEPAHSVEGVGQSSSVSTVEATAVQRPAAKRKYRRHPKPDENAPERPPSAYVIFSNAIREEVKDRKLTFTEIAKAVGERWQNLAAAEKKVYELEAAAAKEEYSSKLSRYKRTNEYRQYQQYLDDFKSKNSTAVTGKVRINALPESTNNVAENKRPKMERDLRTGSSGSAGSLSSSQSASHASGGPYQRRDDSISNYRQSPGHTVHGSPTPGMSKFVSQTPVEASSPSSSTTPVTTTGHLLSMSTGGSGQSNRLQSLPRIMPLEPAGNPTVTSGNLPHIVTDPARMPYSLRRTSNTPHASLLHHDTSKSSMSSTRSSNTSTNSSTFTPITPIDDGRALLPSQPHNNPISSVVHGARPQSWASLPTSTALEHRSGRHNLEAGSDPFHRLSISAEPNNMSDQHGPSHFGSQSQVEAQISIAEAPVARHLQSRIGAPELSRGGIDALSVLALAGHIVDREASQRPRTPP